MSIYNFLDSDKSQSKKIVGHIQNSQNLLNQVKQLFYLNFYYFFYIIYMHKLASFAQLKSLQLTFKNHKIYQSINHQSKLRIFMQAFVFTSWDFMILLKELQRRLTCVDRIWLPPASRSTARFINQIVMDEETDIHPDGHSYISHFEWFIDAMKEAQADTTPIQNFVYTLRKGGTVQDALNQEKIPIYVKDFVSNTVNSLNKPLPYIASQLFYGRENPTPQVFQMFVEALPKDSNCQLFKSYLERHVQVDGEDHGPLSQKIMNDLAARYDPSYELILAGAINSAEQAVKLWDGIYNEIK